MSTPTLIKSIDAINLFDLFLNEGDTIIEDNENNITIICPLRPKSTEQHSLLIDKTHKKFDCPQCEIKGSYTKIFEMKHSLDRNKAVHYVALKSGTLDPILKKEREQKIKLIENPFQKVLTDLSYAFYISLVYNLKKNEPPKLEKILSLLNLRPATISRFFIGYGGNSPFYLRETISNDEFKTRINNNKLAYIIKTLKPFETGTKYNRKTNLYENFTNEVTHHALIIPNFSEIGIVNNLVYIDINKVLKFENHTPHKVMIKYYDEETKLATLLPNKQLIDNNNQKIGNYQKGILFINNTSHKAKFIQIEIQAIINNTPKVYTTDNEGNLYDINKKQIGYYNSETNSISLPEFFEKRQYDMIKRDYRTRKEKLTDYLFNPILTKQNLPQSEEIIITFDPIHHMQIYQAGIFNITCFLLHTSSNMSPNDKWVEIQEKIDFLFRKLTEEYPNKKYILVLPNDYDFRHDLLNIFHRLAKNNVRVINENENKINRTLLQAPENIKNMLNEAIPINEVIIKLYYNKLREINNAGPIHLAPIIYNKTRKYTSSKEEFTKVYAKVSKLDEPSIRSALMKIV